MRGLAVILAFCAASPLRPAELRAESPSQLEFRSILERAFSAHQRADYANSIPLFRRASQLDLSDYRANLLLGIDLLRVGKLVEAVQSLEEASRRQPAEELVYEYVGEAQAGLAHYAEAAIAYGKALESAPRSSQAAIAMVDFNLERFRELGGQLQSSPRGLTAEYRLQAMAYPLSDAAREELLLNAARLDGDAFGIWSELAVTEALRNERDRAMADLARARTRNQWDLRGWEAEALLAAQVGDWFAVSQKFSDIARHSPTMLAQVATDWPNQLRPPARSQFSDSTSAFFLCVDTRSRSCKLGDLEDNTNVPTRVLFEEQRWEHLAALPNPAPQEKQEWYFRGVALSQVGDCNRAIPALERSLGQSPDLIDSMYLLSWCYAQQTGKVTGQMAQTEANPELLHMVRGDLLLRLQGNSEAAINEYRAALAAHPGESRLLERLAKAQLSAGQMEEARGSAEAALRIDRGRITVKRTLADIAIHQREYSVALPYLRELIAANPADVSARVELGTACAQTGFFEEALQNLAPALQQGYPDEKGTLHYLLGTALRRLGRAAESEQAFESARRLSDTSERGSQREQSARP